MRLLLLSDLHLEHGISLTVPPCVEYDVVVLAGDIQSPGSCGVRWAARESTFGGKPVIYVPGNHEFYGREMGSELEEMREAANGTNVHVLNRDVVTIEGVRFLGATLWTDFALPIANESEPIDYSEVVDVARALSTANHHVMDFRAIQLADPSIPGRRGEPVKRRQLRAEDTLYMHHVDRDWLRRELEVGHAGPSVVVTHHAPHRRSVAKRHRSDWVTAAFVSNLPEIFFQGESMWVNGRTHTVGGPAVWVHGHTHTSFDYEVDGCRVVANPRGYRLRNVAWENEQFNPGLIVDVGAPPDAPGSYVASALSEKRHEAALAERGDTVGSSEAARLLGGTVLAAVSMARLRRWVELPHPRAIALNHPRLGLRYPRWQFDRRIWPVVQELASALDTASPTALMNWLETPLGALDGRTPRAALEQGELAERVLALAAGEGL